MYIHIQKIPLNGHKDAFKCWVLKNSNAHLLCWAKNRRLVLNAVKPNVYRETYLKICLTDRPNPSLFRSG